jgi:hypothetical protein
MRECIAIVATIEGLSLSVSAKAPTGGVGMCFGGPFASSQSASVRTWRWQMIVWEARSFTIEF